MCLLPADEHFLRHALELARAAAAFASPNPTVGCVLVRGASILGKGAHRYDGRSHAEIVALEDAAAGGHDVHGATAYVTLEPCAHQGRTGPCANALIAAGISRCVVATVDPNPLVSGEGLHRLRAAGVEVVVAERSSALAGHARRLNDAFAFSIQHGRPFVTLKAAISADSRLAPPPHTRSLRTPHWITGLAARDEVQQLRHTTDVLLSGVGTILADDPELTDRTGLPRRRPLLRVVADGRLRTPLHSRLVRHAQHDVLLVTSQDAPEDRATALRAAGVEVLALPSVGGRLEIEPLMRQLASNDIRSVLLEAGSALNGSFLQAGLVDRVVLYQGPAPLGGDALPLAEGGPSPEKLIGSLHRLSEQTLPHGETVDLRFDGYLHDPWAGV